METQRKLISERGRRGKTPGRSRVARRIGVFAVLLLPLVLVSQHACTQPDESDRSFRPADLVELVKLDSTIRLDIRYATPNNFMKRPMYAEARAFLQRPAAEAVVRASRKLHALGFGLLVFDGYRPWSVTKKFWDETPADKRKFVANPQKGSKHNRGCAVDLTLYDLKTGGEVQMTSPYDDFSEKASATYSRGSAEQRRLRDLLRSIMRSEGFSVEPEEWWHFDFREWRNYRVLDVPFEKLN